MTIAILTLASCGKSNSQSPGDGGVAEIDAGTPTPDASAPTPDAAPTGTAELRFVHAAPNQGTLDVYLKGQDAPLLSGVVYGVTSGQVQVPAGTFQLAVRPAGTPTTTSPIYTSPNIAVSADGTVTAVAAGLVTAVAATNTFVIMALPDAFASAGSGQTRVRVTNTMINPTVVAIDLGDDGSLELPSLATFTTSDAAGIAVTAGSDLTLSMHTANAANTRIASLVVPGELLADGANVNIVLTGNGAVPPRDPASAAAIVVPAPGPLAPVKVRPNPILYALNASPDAGSVDVYLGTRKLFTTSLGFGQIGSFVVPASTSGYTLDYRAAGSDAASAPLASLATGQVDLGQQYLDVLSGLAATNTLVQRAYRDDMIDASTSSITGRMRVVHAGVGVDTIDIGRFTVTTLVWNDVPDFDAIPTGGSSPAAGTLMLASTTSGASLNPAVRASGQPGTTINFSVVQSLTPNQFRFGVFAGAWSPVGTQVPPRYILITVPPIEPWAWTTQVLSPQ